MRNWLFFAALIGVSPLFAQQTVYQAFEADTAAEPRGGIAYLNTFLQTNLRKPTSVAAKGIGGRVIVKGIVEPDGRMSEVAVAQSTNPALNEEAVRVFSRFHAWKPARKGGQPVRQAVTMPVTFRPNAPFAYANGIRTDYFGDDRKPATDSSLAQYKKTSPLDELGMPTGDAVIYERKRNGWRETNRLPLARQKNWQGGPAGQSLYLVGQQNTDQVWQDLVFTVDEAGTVFRQNMYENGRPSGNEISYHANRLVAQTTVRENETRHLMTSWYANGQMRQSWVVDRPKDSFNAMPEQVTAVWDSTGRPLVSNGNGRAVYVENRRSFSDTTRQTPFREEGFYEGGLKQGIWTGRYADRSYVYEEQYDKGVCQRGKSITAGQDTVRYTIPYRLPEFAGGMEGLGQFLASNLRYPASAQKAGVQGRVFVSFVVCQDGTLCDYEVIQSVHPDVDQEAVRVVKAMSGRWQPGIQRGQKVRAKYHLPINFALN